MFPRPDKEPVGPVVERAAEVAEEVRTVAGDVGELATKGIRSGIEAVEASVWRAVRVVRLTRVYVRSLTQELEDLDQHDV